MSVRVSTEDADKLVRRVRCPRCAAGGADRSEDNLAVYMDGHCHCFSCGYHVWAQVNMEQLSLKPQEVIKADDGLHWPKDYMPLLDCGSFRGDNSNRANNWLRSYGINNPEITRNRMGWSESELLLIFPVFDPEGNLIMWQGRNYNSGQKYLTHGPKSDILYLCGQARKGTLIVTEDLISAIKVGREYQAAPLWGSEMAQGLILRASREFNALGIWLDPNKLKQAVTIALRASQYIPTFVVDSTGDPKSYSDQSIIELVEFASREQLYKEKITTDERVELVSYHDVNCDVGPKKPVNDRDGCMCYMGDCEEYPCPIHDTNVWEDGRGSMHGS